MQPKSKFTRAAMASLTFLAACGAAQAATTVTGYDFYGTDASGGGGWTNTYSGTVTPVGNGIDNYTGAGSGTLNSGTVSDSAANNQLFPVSGAEIVLYLSGVSAVSAIDLLGAASDFQNWIPGAITGATVTIDGTSTAVTVTPYGPTCFDGDGGRCDGQLNLSGTALASLATTEVTLSDFQGGWNRYANLAQVTVDATSVSSVPEPANALLLLVGLAAVARRVRGSRRPVHG
jgi:hypothetical protein